MRVSQQQGSIDPIYIILTLIFLTFYAIISSFLQYRKYHIHKGAVAIIVGIIAGFFLFITSGDNYQNITKFNDDIVFTILYPPMVFAAGFNLKKQSFLKNLSYISMFGVLGTFIFFIVVALLILQANQLNLIRDAKDINNIRELSIWEVLLLAACFCSIDTIASEQAISNKKYPKLFSIVFGQGILKDAVTIVLFRAILRLQQLQTPKKFIFYWYTTFQILLNFTILVVCSCIQGIIMAIIVTYLFKKLRFLLKNQGITQTCIIFLIGYAMYSISQTVNCSGVISVLVYGIMLNHYGLYNMSQKGVQFSKSTFQFTSIIAQGLLFLIMGIVVWQGKWFSKDKNSQITHSYIFTFCVIIILMIGRTINVLVVVGLGKLFSKKFKIKKQQIFILIISGLAKGATPFALFTTVNIGQQDKYTKNQGMVLKTTIIMVTILSNIFLNSLIPRIYKNSLLALQQSAKQQLLLKAKSLQKKQKKLAWYYKLQQNYFKPLIIFNYEGRKKEIQQIKQREKRQSLRQTLAEFGENVGKIEEENLNLKQSLLSINCDDQECYNGEDNHNM